MRAAIHSRFSLALLILMLAAVLVGAAIIVRAGPAQNGDGPPAPVHDLQLPLIRNGTPLPPGLVLNEILFWADVDEGGAEWVELYNGRSEAVSLDGWQLTDGDKDLTIALPAWTMPPGSYLVVHLADGDDDADLSDGAGAYYAGGSGDDLGDFEGALSLSHRAGRPRMNGYLRAEDVSLRTASYIPSLKDGAPASSAACSGPRSVSRSWLPVTTRIYWLSTLATTMNYRAVS